MKKIKLQKIVRNLLDKLRKIVRAWNGHLEMFSLPQPIENSRQFLFLDLITFVRLSMAERNLLN